MHFNNVPALKKLVENLSPAIKKLITVHKAAKVRSTIILEDKSCPNCSVTLTAHHDGDWIVRMYETRGLLFKIAINTNVVDGGGIFLYNTLLFVENNTSEKDRIRVVGEHLSGDDQTSEFSIPIREDLFFQDGLLHELPDFEDVKFITEFLTENKVLGGCSITFQLFKNNPQFSTDKLELINQSILNVIERATHGVESKVLSVD